MRLLITGSKGQLGRALVDLASSRGIEVTAHDIDTLDIRDPGAMKTVETEIGPQCVINCAAFTAVDACEEHEEEALRTNAGAVANLSTACNAIGARLLHVSTDYVFSGTADRPYREDDALGPKTAYGRTKLAGEHEAARTEDHVIVRTAWLYGHGGKNFVEAIRGQLEAGNRHLRVVADQFGCPTFCDDLAVALLGLATCSAQGVVHAVNDGATSWHGFAEEIVRLLGYSAEVEPVSTEEFPRPAPRPQYSVLDTSRLHRLLGESLPTWQDALARYLSPQ